MEKLEGLNVILQMEALPLLCPGNLAALRTVSVNGLAGTFRLEIFQGQALDCPFSKNIVPGMPKCSISVG